YESTPDFVSRVRGVSFCDLSERIPSGDDCSELPDSISSLRKGMWGPQFFTVAPANGPTIFAAPVMDTHSLPGFGRKEPAIKTEVPPRFRALMLRENPLFPTVSTMTS